MKARNAVLFALALLLISSTVYLSMKPDSKEVLRVIVPAAKAFALVELFTSEGCSSCPSADKLLGELYAEYHKSNQPVYVLAFHVDYWDYIGWKDSFSNKNFSRRQYRYGEALGLRSVYTPQMVVNGSEEFVGSNRAKAVDRIESALKQPKPVAITLSDVVMSNRSLKAAYSISEIPQGTELNVALAERGLVRNVLRGENGGRKLQHDNVVRSFKTMSPLPSGEMTIEFPEDVNTDNASLVAYLQDTKTMQILAAVNLDLAGKLHEKN